MAPAQVPPHPPGHPLQEQAVSLCHALAADGGASAAVRAQAAALLAACVQAAPPLVTMENGGSDGGVA